MDTVPVVDIGLVDTDLVEDIVPEVGIDLEQAAVVDIGLEDIVLVEEVGLDMAFVVDIVVDTVLVVAFLVVGMQHLVVATLLSAMAGRQDILLELLEALSGLRQRACRI